MVLYNIFIEIKVVRNVILYYFALRDRDSWTHSLSSRSLLSSSKLYQYAENVKHLSILEAPVAKTVHPSESVYESKVV